MRQIVVETSESEPSEDIQDIMLAVATQIVGWKWVSFLGLPTRSHPGYCSKEARTTGIRVRELLSPSQLANKRWSEYLDAKEWKPADMTEPLAYCYCSSSGYAWPDMNVVDEAEDKLRSKRLFGRYLKVIPLVPRTKKEKRSPHVTSKRVRMLACLSVWQEKFGTGDLENIQEQPE